MVGSKKCARQDELDGIRQSIGELRDIVLQNSGAKRTRRFSDSTEAEAGEITGAPRANSTGASAAVDALFEDDPLRGIRPITTAMMTF